MSDVTRGVPVIDVLWPRVLARLCSLAIAAAVLAPHRASADETTPAWPVRLNVAMPLGTMTGPDVHGAIWGFKVAAHAYPISPHGLALGLFAESLSDFSTRAASAAGLSASLPACTFAGGEADVRVGLFGGWRQVEGPGDGTRAVIGAQTSIEVPAYLYDFRVGLRVDASLDGDEITGRTIAVDVDLAAVVALFALALH